MTLDAPSTARPPGLIARAKGLLLTPCAEWDRIDAEPATVGGLFRTFVLPLAAIGPLAIACNGLIFNRRRFDMAFGSPVLSIVLEAAIAYALSLVMTCVLALVIDSLAPGFCGCKNRIKAFKVAAYAGAAGWIAGVFGALPALGPLVLVGLGYSIYLLYRGLPRLMRIPSDRALSCTALTVGVALTLGALVFVALGSLAVLVGGFGGEGDPLADMTWGGGPGRLTLKGGGTIDVAGLEAAARQAKAADRQRPADAPRTATKAITPDRLEGLLPDHLGGFARSDLQGNRRSAGGYSISIAKAAYRNGDARLSVRLSDLAAASALTSMATALDPEMARHTADGYQRVGRVDGRLTAEQYDRHSNHARYSVLVADRFLVEADGKGMSLGQLETAADGLDYASLQALAEAGAPSPNSDTTR